MGRGGSLALPVLGGPQYTVCLARGPEGVGVFLRSLAWPKVYQRTTSRRYRGSAS